MATFADDFNRPDGPVGNGWTVLGFQTRILSQEVAATSNGFIARVITPSSPYHRVEWDSRRAQQTSAHCSGIVRSNGLNSQHYYGSFTERTGGYTVAIGYKSGGINYSLASGSVSMTVTNPVRGTLTYNAGALTLTINGVAVLTANDNRYAANDYIGVLIGNVANFADNVLIADAPAVAFDAEPEPLVEMAIPEEVTFTGEGTAWEPGTPGQPIFQVDKGTLDSQTVTSATTAAAMYTPPQAEDVATFTDPSTGLTDQVALSTGFQVNAGGECKLTDDGASILNLTGGDEPDGRLIRENTVLDIQQGLYFRTAFLELMLGKRVMVGENPEPPPGGYSFLDTLWWILNGHGVVDEDHNIFDYAGTAAVESTNAVLALSAIRTGELLTLQSILDAIALIPPADLSAVLAELSAIRTAGLLTLQSPIDAVESARGVGLPTIKNARDDIAGIRTGANYSLDSVRTWVEAVRGIDLPTVRDVLDALEAGVTVDLQPVLDAIAAVRGLDSVDLTQLHDQTGQFAIDTAGHFGHIDTAIANVRGADTRDLTEVYDAIKALPQSLVDLSPVLNAITALSNKIDALSFGPVLWPGAAGVDFGVPVALGGEQTIVGPMDGAVIEIAGSGEGKSRYGSGDWTNKYRMGWYMFVGSGDWAEDFRWLGPNRQVLTPQRLLTASKLVLYCYPGVAGTITPWTLRVS